MEKTYGNGNAARGIAAPAGYAMNPDTYLYFAYGSNMNPERIRQRIPEARPVGRAPPPPRGEARQCRCKKRKERNDEDFRRAQIPD